MARIYNNGVGVKTRFHVSICLGRSTSAPRQTMEPMSKASHHAFDTVEQLHAWLRLNHASESELWVRIFKKATGKPSVTWDDVWLPPLPGAGSTGYVTPWTMPRFCNA